ncbi:hypothetical protein HPP92_012723 [Vanilla planifolia]|uniref:Uncharacterized protein n=1 Tax=Vanilla planifolia TaxID=51239 RepID=A0A835QXD7_VANPL|nr:hypothetical protein HPP92_012723 [Vanilla planifolia]
MNVSDRPRQRTAAGQARNATTFRGNCSSGVGFRQRTAGEDDAWLDGSSSLEATNFPKLEFCRSRLLSPGSKAATGLGFYR